MNHYSHSKVLSENSKQYQDAVIYGIRQCLGLDDRSSIPCEQIEKIKMGTTVATNALLKRRGEPSALITTEMIVHHFTYLVIHDTLHLLGHLPKQYVGQVYDLPEMATFTLRSAFTGHPIAQLDWYYWQYQYPKRERMDRRIIANNILGKLFAQAKTQIDWGI